MIILLHELKMPASRASRTSELNNNINLQEEQQTWAIAWLLQLIKPDRHRSLF